jgi:hypothetical protein
VAWPQNGISAAAGAEERRLGGPYRLGDRPHRVVVETVGVEHHPGAVALAPRGGEGVDEIHAYFAQDQRAHPAAQRAAHAPHLVGDRRRHLGDLAEPERLEVPAQIGGDVHIPNWKTVDERSHHRLAETPPARRLGHSHRAELEHAPAVRLDAPERVNVPVLAPDPELIDGDPLSVELPATDPVFDERQILGPGGLQHGTTSYDAPLARKGPRRT